MGSNAPITLIAFIRNYDMRVSECDVLYCIYSCGLSDFVLDIYRVRLPVIVLETSCHWAATGFAVGCAQVVKPLHGSSCSRINSAHSMLDFRQLQTLTCDTLLVIELDTVGEGEILKNIPSLLSGWLGSCSLADRSEHSQNTIRGRERHQKLKTNT
jgi:hypothetical protein